MFQKVRYVFIMVLTFVILFSSSACSREPIRLGFIGSLTTKNSQLSIDGRNALQLGINQVNTTGGINGRSLELVVKDDGASTEIALQKHAEFVEEGIELVIGHMTSNMAEAVMQSQSSQLLFLSPSMSTSLLTGLDDYFIRTAPITDNQASTFFELVDQLSVKQAVIVYDLMNAEYSERVAKYLNNQNSSIELSLVPFDSRIDDLEVVAKNILSYDEVELVFLISQSIDTAVLAQHIKKENDNLILASVSWSMTEDLILNGGVAVDGMYFIGLLESEKPSQAKLDFEQAFLEQYQYEPSFISYLTYDAFNVMIDALKVTKSYDADAIKEAILGMGTIQGMDETYSIDAYGDNDKGYLMYQLINNQFVPIFQ